VGAGTGRYALEAARRGRRVVGIDPSPEMLAVARRRTAGQPVDLIQAGAARLPFLDRSFEAALAVTSLCFVSDPVAVLREVARVLTPDGRLVLGELNRWSLWALVRRLEGLVRSTTYRAAHFRAIGALRTLLAASGFALVRWEGMLLLPPVNNATFLRRLEPVERLGRRWAPRCGAFLAVEARPVILS
jgi:ubiquinone/menaquinone biosynthesis C-methylase UbiE